MGKLIRISSLGTIHQDNKVSYKEAMRLLSCTSNDTCAWRYETTESAITAEIQRNVREQDYKANLIGDQTRVKIQNLGEGVY
jgi:hypothetical protein